jgi:hypothetical protein
MARHAGFSAVGSITEDTVNKVIATYFQQVEGPYFFPMPTTVGVGSAAVTFAGILALDPPTVELHENSGDLVTAHFTFRTTLKAQLSGESQMRTWSLQLDVTGDTQPIAQVSGNQVLVSLNAAQTTISPLVVTVLSGPPLLQAVADALESPDVAQVLTAAVRSLILTATPPMLTANYQHTVPGNFKESNFSVFNWFTISLSAGRIVVRPLEKAITIAVDLAGFSQGDPTQLTDLTAAPGTGTMYLRTVYQTTDPSAPPYLVARNEPPGANIAICFNMGVLQQIVARQVSASIANTPITKKVVLNWVSLGYSQFDLPLRGSQDGLDLHFNATANYGPSVTADGDAYIQAFLQTYDGPTSFIRPDTWHVYVAVVNVDLPWWADVAIGVTEFLLTFLGLFALMVSMFNVSLIGLVADFLQSIQDALSQADAGNIAATAQGQLQSAVGASLSAPWSSPLQGTSFPRWDGDVQCIAFTPDTIDLGVNTWVNFDDAAPQPMATITPSGFPATDVSPIPMQLTLRSDLAKMAGNNLMLVWQVVRDDTGATILTTTIPYTDSSNGPVINHQSQDLYTVNSFTVYCTATLTLGNQVGQIWAGSQQVIIDDNLDRSHSFVHWGPHPVHFHAANWDPKDPIWWEHIRRSRIHRTAVQARCLMLRLKASKEASEPPSWRTIQYFDNLPFPWADLNRYRGPLCEYCFFGGPDKMTPYSEDDWFLRFPQLKFSIGEVPLYFTAKAKQKGLKRAKI